MGTTQNVKLAQRLAGLIEIAKVKFFLFKTCPKKNNMA